MPTRDYFTRRKILAATGTLAASALAGCSESSEDPVTKTPSGNTTQPPSTPSTETETPPENPVGRDLPAIAAPDEPMVYYPSHIDGMQMVGMKDVGPYKVSLSYTLPHDFWVFTGNELSYAPVENAQILHLMATVWDPEHKQTFPIGSPAITIEDDSGERIVEKSLWPMLSQQMGAHFGDNIGIPSQGDYTVTLQIDGMPTQQLDSYTGQFKDSETVTFEMSVDYDEMNEIQFQTLNDSGYPGAVPPMQMDMRPTGVLPDASELPGETIAELESADATFIVQTLSDVPDGVETTTEDADNVYLAVSARTPYNQYPLPFMGVKATLTGSEGESVFDNILSGSMHPEIGFHYGAAVPEVMSGQELQVRVGSSPQIARHRGYQTAFLDFEPMRTTL